MTVWQKVGAQLYPAFESFFAQDPVLSPESGAILKEALTPFTRVVIRD